MAISSREDEAGAGDERPEPGPPAGLHDAETAARLHDELLARNRTVVLWTLPIFSCAYVAWCGFDYLLAPERMVDFLWIRLAVAVPSLAVFGAVLRGHLPKRSFSVMAGFLGACCLGIAIMLPLVSDRALLPYALGAGMPVVAGGVLPIWPWRWTVGATLFGLAANVTVLVVVPSEASAGSIAAASFAWTTLAAIAVLTAVLKDAAARREFSSRVALERERSRADAARTEAIAARDQVEAMLVRLQELDQQKTHFFQNVSHELRTPLTVLLAPLASLAEQMPPAARPKLDMIERNAQRLLRLVNQLLDFAKLEDGKKAAIPTPQRLRALVEPIVEGFDVFARSKGLRLELRGAEELPAVLVDPDDFDKVLCNLLSNACKFTEPGGSVVVRLDAAEGGVRVAVKDTGIGIAEADLAKLFERFSQVDGRTDRRYEGSGIGLALAKDLVEAGGGRIAVESELGIGSTFTVWLPTAGERDLAARAPLVGRDRARDAVLALEAEIGPATVAPVASRPEDGELPLALVVEDNADMRGLIAEVCAREFRVAEATDGESGLVLARELHPAIVVSDVMMPGMDGHALVHALRAHADTASIPVVLLTAKAGLERRLEAIEGGADDYLTKPFDPRELLARLRSLMRLRALQLSLRAANEELEQRVIAQSIALERARELGRYLPPELARAVAEQGRLPPLERRRVTVFRLELRGFEMLARAREPEDVAAVLSAHLSAVVDAAFSHGATVERFVRDRVHGFFGAPEALEPEEGARRAARLAADLHVSLGALAEHMTTTGEARPAPTMALASGVATVGTFGSSHRQEYAALGIVCDEAEAILAAAPRGSVVCAESTWQLLGDPAAGVEWRSVTTTGGGAVRVWRLEGEEDEPLAPTLTRPSLSSGPAASTLAPGALLGGRYRVVDEIGEGGMGRVFRAIDEKLGVEVAIKLWKDGERPHPERLRREVRLARLVTHRNVARIYDIGEWNGNDFVSMECLEGEELADRLDREGPPSIEEARALLLQLCDGLSAAHAVGVVHRDLKPSNVFLERGGRAVILDFGIALALEGGEAHLTKPGRLVGTPYYMAPEQFRGGVIDPRTDIYSFGAVAFEILTGERVFETDSLVQLTFMHCSEPPRDPSKLRPDIPPRLEAVVLRCLAKDPTERFDSAAEIRALLE